MLEIFTNKDNFSETDYYKHTLIQEQDDHSRELFESRVKLAYFTAQEVVNGNYLRDTIIKQMLTFDGMDSKELRAITYQGTKKVEWG